ncbi:hypothetical protein CAPTEDRAFT_130746 [Capitella teleta]|uniref:Neutral ceramidase n=1 Tax=Capitella teleta TaxID=283909 RepID=R7V5T0_CAPTE|nr:hypothetical protein CAPTEDRAFT_130746 [Capitella teleta]|eukprot:ELU11671.1 hypothetical protein CAPTEDRAFT_130746 [Capitella teleta]
MAAALRLTILALLCVQLALSDFRVGRSIADITGQAAEGLLYGYASPEQDARGLHTRQYSRAFAFDADGKRAVFVVAEITMISQAVHTEVLELLAAEFGDMYTRDNVMLTPTHSHSAPGGYHTYVMYGFPSEGFETLTFRAAVDGIVKSIREAHHDLQSGQVRMSAADLTVTSVNRSPFSYKQNPQSERSKYTFDVDVTLSMVKLMDNKGDPMAMLSLFPVHTTSMKNDNHLVSSDNKGYAAQMMERALNRGKFPLKGSCDVIAAFAQTAEGDVSPNTNHARCEEDDSLCDSRTSTCLADKRDPNLCTGRGPTGAKKETEDEFTDTEIIGSSQYIHAMVKLCRPAMGYSFGAGATDGPGVAPFTQGMLKGNFIYDRLVEKFFPGSRTPELLECHKPKPVLLPTANMQEPYPYWQPEVVPVQLLRVGKILFLGIPGKVTTMAGRRLQESAKQVFSEAGMDVKPFVMSMANSYSSYIVTPEEYTVQRYEAASTIFGPYTLNGYIDVVKSLAEAMVKDENVGESSPPPDLRYPDEARAAPRVDRLPDGKNYGDVLSDVEEEYHRGDLVSVSFAAGNPRNNLLTDETFLEVQRFDDRLNDWLVVFTDAHWETRSPCWFLNMSSYAVVEWKIPNHHYTLGQYRIVHVGHAKYPDGVVVKYTGASSVFRIVPTPPPTTTTPEPTTEPEVEPEVDEATWYSAKRSGPKSDEQYAEDLAAFFAQLADTKMKLRQ